LRYDALTPMNSDAWRNGTMQLMLVWVGRLAGALGVLVSLVAVLARASGSFQVGSFQALTLLEAGTSAMVLGGLAYVASMADPASR
jgi:hypothetical protein